MRMLPLIALLALSTALAACSPGPRQVDQAPPTVTYSYLDRDDEDEIARQAELYCEENYGRDAVLVEREREDGEYEATFACE